MKVHSSDHSVPDKRRLGPINRFFEKRLVGISDAADFTTAWKNKFQHAPTWCDADLSLQQINRGKARGNRIALYSRAFFQHNLFKIGCFVQRFAWPMIIISTILYTACNVGLGDIVIETDLVKLWVSQGGRLEQELNFLAQVQQDAKRVKRDSPIQPVNAKNGSARPPPAKKGPELPKENGLGGGFQVVIQTPKFEGENALTKHGLMKHVNLMEEISQYSVELHGENWTLSDICFKPPAPEFKNSPLSKVMSSLLDKIIPCIWITPIDCFWEGAKPLGPRPSINLGAAASSFINSLPKGNVTWKNLNPTAVMTEVGQLFDLGPIGNFFERAGIGAAYLDRPCIDPLDFECPPTSPNYFDRCSALKKFNDWNKAKTDADRISLAKEEIKEDEEQDESDQILQGIFGKKRRKRDAEKEKAKPKKDEDYYAYDDDADYISGIPNNTDAKKSALTPDEKNCLEYGRSFLQWMSDNENRWGEFLTEKEQPKTPNYGEAMTGGCKGFGKNIMEWPEDLIVGGVKRSADGKNLLEAEALQSVFLVASPFDIFLRYRDPKPELKPGLDTSRWTPRKAEEVLFAWQRNFTKKLYGHAANKEVEGVRQFHPLASTSIADMLEEFSQFNYGIIFAGYGLMVVYAAFTQARIDGRWLAIQSNVLLSFVGVILVTYSSICGLGLSTLMGINFNAATTQIVPFLSLGLGIDDMFLLLHNYDEIINIVKKDEMGYLLKETGLSVMVTSCNNILAFIAGYVLPIPALRSFCSQTAILLAFNLISLIFVFPAFIELDMRRQKKGKRDLAYCCTGGKEDNSKITTAVASKATLQEVSSKAELTHSLNGATTKDHVDRWERNQPWYTVGGFLTNIYIPALQKTTVKIAVLGVTLAGVVFGLYGMYTSTLGLELSDVLPEHTAPAAFLRAREKYFSFYPMNAVLRGQDIDIPNEQRLIEEYRRRMAASSYMITPDGKKDQPYWMSLMRIWLKSLDDALDKDIANDVFDLDTGKIQPGKKPTPEGHVAQKLMCSVGQVYNCTGRLGKMKFVVDGIINVEGFYNYLTAWYNIDNMMYYVSQASFVPIPPGWAMTPDERPVPPARKLLYSQIPFYQTGLTDTPAIVKMIDETRAICEEFTDKGLSNFPSGIAFTFWEQYLSLRWNLFLAICIIAFAVFAVISALMFNPWAATLVMVIVVVLTIQLGGFMGLFGVKMNPISAVTLICAVGIGVEFTAHVVLCFLTSLGTVNDRLECCLQHMFVPVFHGAISTLLGIVMLVFSEFDFVVKYFFVVMTVLVILGIFNGLCVLPVLLTLVGPSCELTCTDGSHRLPCPPPLSEQEQYGGKERLESGLRHRKGDVEMESRNSSEHSD